MDSLRDRIARALQREAYRRDALLAEIAEHEIAPLYTDMADVALALFSDELGKVVDLDDLNDLHGKIADR